MHENEAKDSLISTLEDRLREPAGSQYIFKKMANV